MAKRGYKLQEFVAHSGNVNCLRFGRKNFRHFLTGGDDNKVNLWSIGKPTCSMSLCGHSSPVESVAFDSAEVLVLAGSSAGAIKLWDLEEAKMVRTLNGHRSYCTAVEFHPFGEFFASGSMDTNLRIWDIRKKGCIHTYKGHTRGISTIKFTPDGRWVVSGGFDNAVKVWDLTAGKLLHDFKFHEGHIRSIEFHPLEFLLATGSADRTVKFWDLETFEMIGSTRREAAGVRSVTFHPDGRNMFCGLDDSLKVYSWEPVVCHDSVDMGWSTLHDLCIDDGKLLGGAYYENTVGVWVADVSLIAPYGGGVVVEQNDSLEVKVEDREIHLDRAGSQKWCGPSPDDDSKEIKNIYVDTGRNCASLKKVGSISSINVVHPSETKDVSDVASQKKCYSIGLNPKTSGTDDNCSSAIPSIESSDSPDAKEYDENQRNSISTGRASTTVPLKVTHSWKVSNENFLESVSSEMDIPDAKELIGNQRESISNGRVSRARPLKLPHVRKASNGKFDMEKMSVALESVSSENDTPDAKELVKNQRESISTGRASIALPLKLPHTWKPSDGRFDIEKTSIAFESVSSENMKMAAVSTGDRDFKSRLNTDNNAKEFSEFMHSDRASADDKSENIAPVGLSSDQENSKEAPDSRNGVTAVKVVNGVAVVQGRTRSLVERFEKREKYNGDEVHTPVMITQLESPPPDLSPLHTPAMVTITAVQEPKTSSLRTPDMTTDTEIHEPKASPLQTPDIASDTVSQEAKTSPLLTPRTGSSAESQTPTWNDDENCTPDKVAHVISQASESPALQTTNTATQMLIEPSKAAPLRTSNAAIPAVTRRPKLSPLNTPNMTSAVTRASRLSSRTPHVAAPVRIRAPRTSPLQNSNRQTVEPEESVTNVSSGNNESSIVENLMETHDVVSSMLHSRLAKLQMIRHYWVRNDVKGAINATKKLPDYSVQADIVSILAGRMEIITLDLFSCLLPVLLGLLDSKVERHAVVSLEMLLKLVAVFGPMVQSTVSAPRTIGVDLHAEERLECCKQCFVHLQNIQKILPSLMRRGGLVAKSALELKLVLQGS